MDEDSCPLGLCGLTNIGNTCYMNSALQCLSNCTPLTNYFLNSAELKIENKNAVAKNYKKLITDIWDEKRTENLTPTSLLRAIRLQNSTFRGYSQQDTQEFLRCLMDRLHEELKSEVINSDEEQSESEEEEEKSPPNTPSQKRLLGGHSNDVHDVDMERSRNFSTSASSKRKTEEKRTKKESEQVQHNSIITCVFDGKLLSSVQCLTCNRLSNKLETFQDLSLPIPNKEEISRIYKQTVMTTSNSDAYADTGWVNYLWGWLKSWFVGAHIRLQDCLAAFFTSDELKGDNMYSCEKCKKLRNGLKYSRVNSLPEVLCIHLKRFRHDIFYSSKINTFISFPLTDLNMQPFLSKDCIMSEAPSKYDLTAAITHFGSVGGGHYISHAKNNGRWYEFNDSMVHEVSEDKVSGTEAYVLFYTLKAPRTVQEEYVKKIEQFYENTPSQTDVQYICREWYAKFISCLKPGPITNYNYLCKHSAIKIEHAPSIQQLFIALPSNLSEELFEIYGGGPELASLDICKTCQMLATRGDTEFQTFNEMYEKSPSVSRVCKISLKWYDQWLAFAQNKTLEPPGAIDNQPLIDGDSDTDGEGTSYGRISADTWNYIHSIYGGGPAVYVKTKDGESKETPIEPTPSSQDTPIDHTPMET